MEREPKWNCDAKSEVQRELPLPDHLEKRKAEPSRVVRVKQALRGSSVLNQLISTSEVG